MVKPKDDLPFATQNPKDIHEEKVTTSKGSDFAETSRSSLSSGDRKLLAFVILVAAGVQLFMNHFPDDVRLGESTIKLDGAFDDFESIHEYVPYIATRTLPAALGVATAPVTYLLLRAFDCHATSALLASLVVVFENGTITKSHFTLLDSPLVFFTASAMLWWTYFSDETQREPFTRSWWTWLALTGLSLAAGLCCDWQGVFTIITTCFESVFQVWREQDRVPSRTLARLIIARLLCLVVVPLALFFLVFQIRLNIIGALTNGVGQIEIVNNTYATVALGSEITFRHFNTHHGYIHSHDHFYPNGSQQQQVTLYPYRDENTVWRITNSTRDGAEPWDWRYFLPQPVTSGMRVRFQHVPTEKRLHSHDIPPPVTIDEYQSEVSAYGMHGFGGDGNDNWILEFAYSDVRDSDANGRLRTQRTLFRLRHEMKYCYLFSHHVELPEWAPGQQEVTCKFGEAEDSNSLWLIETSTHINSPPYEEVLSNKTGFFANLHQVMWTNNAGLTDRHSFWIQIHRRMDPNGNPMIWQLSGVSMTLFLVFWALSDCVGALRNSEYHKNSHPTEQYALLSVFLFMGWGLHILSTTQPSLYPHFSALYFSILLSCVVFDFFASSLRQRTRWLVIAILVIFLVSNFAKTTPLAYRAQWTEAMCNKDTPIGKWWLSCSPNDE